MVFDDFENIEELMFDFVKNRSKNIDDITFFTKFEGLRISKKELEGLKSLHLKSTLLHNIGFLGYFIKKCISLEDGYVTSLDLSSRSLYEIPDVYLSFKNLKELNLSDNHLNKIPGSVGDFKDLKYLYLSKNNFKRIPEFVYYLPNLKILDLSNNKIEYIDSNIMKIKTLEELNLSYNYISNLPSSIKQLDNLKSLEIQGNKISSLSTLPNLKYLRASNPIFISETLRNKRDLDINLMG